MMYLTLVQWINKKLHVTFSDKYGWLTFTRRLGLQNPKLAHMFTRYSIHAYNTHTCMHGKTGSYCIVEIVSVIASRSVIFVYYRSICRVHTLRHWKSVMFFWVIVSVTTFINIETWSLQAWTWMLISVLSYWGCGQVVHTNNHCSL